MKKYEVNYKRSFPEHRLDFDYKYYQSIKTSPLEQLKIWKSGFNYGSMKYIGPNLSIGITLALLFVGVYKTIGVYNQDVLLKTNSRTSIKWGAFHEVKSFGRFDIIHNRFENQPGGIRDWA